MFLGAGGRVHRQITRSTCLENLENVVHTTETDNYSNATGLCLEAMFYIALCIPLLTKFRAEGYVQDCQRHNIVNRSRHLCKLNEIICMISAICFLMRNRVYCGVLS